MRALLGGVWRPGQALDHVVFRALVDARVGEARRGSVRLEQRVRDQGLGGAGCQQGRDSRRSLRALSQTCRASRRFHRRG